MEGWILVTAALFGEVDRWHTSPTPFSDMPFPFAVHATAADCERDLKLAYDPHPVPADSRCERLQDAIVKYTKLFKDPYRIEPIVDATDPNER